MSLTRLDTKNLVPIYSNELNGIKLQLLVDDKVSKDIEIKFKTDFGRITIELLKQWQETFSIVSNTCEEIHNTKKSSTHSFINETHKGNKPNDTYSAYMSYTSYTSFQDQTEQTQNEKGKEKVNDKKKEQGKEEMLCRSIYEKTIDNWTVKLILEKKINPNTSEIKLGDLKWDSIDNIYIELKYNKSIENFNESDKKSLEKEFTVSVFGGYNTSNNTKQYILETINKITNSNKKYINELFNAPKLINKNIYFNDIINKLHLQKFCISDNYFGIEYLILIDSGKSTIYYINKDYIKNDPINSSCGICLLSAIKYNNTFIIRRVIIYNNIYLNYKTVNELNSKNKKVGELLELEYVTYGDLKQRSYKKQITAYKDVCNNRNGRFMIEITTVDEPFFDSNVYSWTSKKLPITFLCKECPEKYNTYEKQKNKKLYILYTTINKHDLFLSGIKQLPFHNELFPNIDSYLTPIQFSPSTWPNAFLFYSSMDLDKQYISLVFDYKHKEWVFIERMQKSDTSAYGDDFKYTELNIWNSYRNPVLFSDLIIDKSKINDQMYFINTKNPMHENPIKMNNYVKRSFIKKGMESVIDLASGRASDLMNYRNAGVKSLLFCEIDADAIDEIIERKFRLTNPNTFLSVCQTDLNAPYKKNIDIIQNYVNKVSNIFCFFAFHYLTNTLSHVKNTVKLINLLLNKNGEFLYTAFDGDVVINLLREHNGKWETFEKGCKKYSIISKFKESDIKTTNRPIKLILPFNSNKYYYDENLINEKIVDAEFKKVGIKCIKQGSFIDFYDEFRKKYEKKHLTDDDKIFIGLYKYKLYKKV